MLRSLWRNLPGRRMPLPRFGIGDFRLGRTANDDAGTGVVPLPVRSRDLLRGQGSIEFHGVSKALGLSGKRVPVLQDMNAIFPRGRVVGVLGASGSGKSTLVQLLTGNMRADAGRIVRGMSVSWPTGARDIFRRELTLRKNVRIVSGLYGAWAPDMLEAVKEIGKIRSQDLDRPLSEVPADLVIRGTASLCYALDFDCYIADDLLTGGSKHFRDHFKELFVERKSTHSLIIVTKNIIAYRELCDDIHLLEGGTLRTFANKHDAIQAFKTGDRAKALD